MPIVERPVADAPLTQGDILKGIPLFITSGAWTDRPDVRKQPFEFCIVVSRPCAIAHKKHITVAGIARYPAAQPKGIATLDDLLIFLTGARDGLTTPDVFHLGQVAELGNGRFCARLDALHPVEIPTEPADMAKFLAEKRVATLHIDFARALHVRLFNAFANMGFDDHSWPSDKDLEWLITLGKKDIAEQEAAVHKLQAEGMAKAAEGKQPAAKDQPAFLAAKKSLQDLKDMVQPYEEELAKRKQNAVHG